MANVHSYPEMVCVDVTKLNVRQYIWLQLTTTHLITCRTLLFPYQYVRVYCPSSKETDRLLESISSVFQQKQRLIFISTGFMCKSAAFTQATRRWLRMRQASRSRPFSGAARVGVSEIRESNSRRAVPPPLRQ